MRRRFRRILRKWGIPQDRSILFAILLVTVGLSSMYLWAADKVYANFGFLWGEKTQISAPYEKVQRGVIIRQGIFEGEAFFNSEKNCWEIRGKTREGSFGIMKEEVRTQNCRVFVNTIE